MLFKNSMKALFKVILVISFLSLLSQIESKKFLQKENKVVETVDIKSQQFMQANDYRNTTDIPNTDVVNKNNNLNKMVIGVITEPFPENSNTSGNSTIVYSYVSYIQSFGFDTLPLFHDYSDEEFSIIIPKLNGLLFQGGDRNLTEAYVEKQYGKIIEIANKAKIPIWFTCQGFQYLIYYLSDFKTKLSNFDSWKIYSTVNLTDSYKSNNTTKTFKYFNKKDLYLMQTTPSVVEYHNFGYHVDDVKNSKLNDILLITSTAKDLKGDVYVNSVESRDFSKNKYFGLQFHPEKAVFNEEIDFMEKHANDSSIQISQKIFYGFYEEALKTRKTNHLTDEEKLKYGVFNVMNTSTNLGYDKKTFIFEVYYFVGHKLATKEETVGVEYK